MATLKTNRIKAFYNCKQEELYQILLHGWDKFLRKPINHSTPSLICELSEFLAYFA